ncbi:hypothetical protein EXIGLDRAFT_601120, partial [Exidia glandulosa HHB12029]
MRYEDKVAWQEENAPPTMQVTIDSVLKERFIEGYKSDPFYKDKGIDVDERSWYAGNKFYRGKDGLIFFREANFLPRLCVPKDLTLEVMRIAHESPYETAHG